MSPLSTAVSGSLASEQSADAWLSYLRIQDDPLRWEAPLRFNRCAELRRFARFVQDFETEIGRRVDHAFGSGIEEAAFHGEMFFEGASIRFSNFGRMIAFLSDTHLSAGALRLFAMLADRHGYVIIPDELLVQPYTLANGQPSRTETWGSRFFGTR